jgi:tetratricopeptide (TPR) repeat protein
LSIAARFLLALAVTVGACGAAPRPHVDPDAMREARRGGAAATSPRAIAHYLEARRCANRGDAACAAAELRIAVAYDEGSAELRVALAEALEETGRAEAAEGEARQALLLDPEGGGAAVRAHLVVARVARARPDAGAAGVAILAYRHAARLEAARLQPGERPDPEPWAGLARAYVEVGDEAAASRAADDLEERAPGDASARLALADALLARGDPARAERALRRAAEVARDAPEVWRLLARAHEALRRPADVIEDLAALLRCAPEDPAALLALARAALDAGSIERARELAHQFLRAGGGAPDAAHARDAVLLAERFGELAGGEDALEIARAASASVGPDPRLRLVEGLALRALRRWADAGQALLGIGPDDGGAFPAARAALGDVLARAGRAAEAERLVQDALRRSPGEPRLVAARALLLERAGKTPEALVLLEDAARERDRAHDLAGVAALRTALAEALLRAGRPADAAAALEPAAAAAPRARAVLLALAASHREAGAPERAAAELRAVLALDGDDPAALALLARVLGDRGEALDEAERLARRAVELRPRSAAPLDALGAVLLRRGDAAAAAAVLERAEALSGRDPVIADRLGDAYRAAGRPADATAAWRRALAGAGDEPPAVALRLRTELGRKLALPIERRPGPGAARPAARLDPAAHRR